MSDELRSAEPLAYLAGRAPRPGEARLILGVALTTALISVAICVAAVLAPAPAVVLPLIVTICVGCPVFAAWRAPLAVATLRADRVRRGRDRALEQLRRGLDQLPETEHPLGL